MKPDSLQHFVQWIKIPNPNFVTGGNQPRYIKWAKKLSDVPLILRDMGPPDGSIFDPKKTWESEKPLYEAQKEAEAKALAGEFDVEEVVEKVEEVTLGKAKSAKEKAEEKKERKAQQDAKKALKNAKAGKISKAEMIAKNDKKKENSVHKADIERMKNNNTIDLLLDAKVSTVTGQLQRMLKMLSIAVSAKDRGKSGSSEEEVLDILWALEEMEVFRAADEEIARDKDLRKALKKKAKEAEKEAEKEAKDGKKDKKGEKKDKKKKKGEEAEAEKKKDDKPVWPKKGHMEVGAGGAGKAGSTLRLPRVSLAVLPHPQVLRVQREARAGHRAQRQGAAGARKPRHRAHHQHRGGQVRRHLRGLDPGRLQALRQRLDARQEQGP